LPVIIILTTSGMEWHNMVHLSMECDPVTYPAGIAVTLGYSLDDLHQRVASDTLCSRAHSTERVNFGDSWF
jgi:hypothetical protein